MADAAVAVLVEPTDPAPDAVAEASPVASLGAPGVREGHILTLREALTAAVAATAEARWLAEQRAEALAAESLRADAAEAERDAARTEAAETRAASLAGATAAAAALREAQAETLAQANRRRWEIVAHAARLDEALTAAQAARAELSASTIRFQAATQAILALAESEAAALKQQVEAANTARASAQRDLARWRRGGRLARALRALRSA